MTPQTLPEKPCCGCKAELGFDISYGIEAEQTTPAARNYTFRLAGGPTS